MRKFFAVLTLVAVVTVLSFKVETIHTDGAEAAQPELLATGHFLFGFSTLINGSCTVSTVQLSIGGYSPPGVVYPVLDVSVAPSATPQTFTATASSDPDFANFAAYLLVAGNSLAT